MLIILVRSILSISLLILILDTLTLLSTRVGSLNSSHEALKVPDDEGLECFYIDRFSDFDTFYEEVS